MKLSGVPHLSSCHGGQWMERGRSAASECSSRHVVCGGEEDGANPCTAQLQLLASIAIVASPAQPLPVAASAQTRPQSTTQRVLCLVFHSVYTLTQHTHTLSLSLALMYTRYF
ncbi:hypothetical protein MTO96_004715 [Rhipicephalus appendiculatus]